MSLRSSLVLVSAVASLIICAGLALHGVFQLNDEDLQARKRTIQMTLYVDKPATIESSKKRLLAAVDRGTVRKLHPRGRHRDRIFNKQNKQRRLPDVIIFGAKKSGTKALITFLGAHSKIAAAEQEIHFFDRKYHLGLEAYRNLLPLSTDDQLTIEKTPGYLLSREGPDRIRNSLPDTVKLMVILREPVTRVISEYTHVVSRFAPHRKKQKYGEVPTLESLIYKNGSREFNQQNKIIRTSDYARVLQPWYETFGRNRIHVIDGETFVKRPWIELEKIQRFLNLPIELTKHSFRLNSTKGFYCVANKKLNKPGNRDHVVCLPPNKGRRHQPIDASTKHDLENYYKQREHDLIKLVQRKLSWMR